MTASRRYDSTDYLERWKATGEYPRIHRAIAEAIDLQFPYGVKLMDLGSSTGLLTHQLRVLGYSRSAVEPDRAAVAAGAPAGTYGNRPILQHPITPAELPRFQEFLATQAPYGIVARRIFPELWTALHPANPSPWDGDPWQTFIQSLEDSTVQGIMIEGRVWSEGKTTHPLGRVDKEIAALGPAWKPTMITNQIALLTRK